MEKIKRILLNEIYDVSSNERTSLMYKGYLIKHEDNLHHFVFSLDEGLVRMQITNDGERLIVEQKFTDSSAIIELMNKSEGKYQLSLNNGYILKFKIRCEEIKFSFSEIDCKFYLLDKNGEVISIHHLMIKEDA